MKRLFFPILVCSVAACSAPPTPDPAVGETGRLRFTYEDHDFTYEDLGCHRQCPASQPLALGAHSTIRVHGDDAAARYRPRVLGSAVVVEAERFACMCHEELEHGSSAVSVPPEEPCLPPAVRRCDKLLDLAAAKEGTATLEIVDAADVVIDRYPTTVAIGARLEPLVQALPRHGGTLRNVPVGPDGAFETNGPVRLFLSARAVASQGVLLRASARDVRIDSPQLKLHESRAGGGQPSALVEAPLRATITATGLALTTTFDVDVQPVP